MSECHYLRATSEPNDDRHPSRLFKKIRKKGHAYIFSQLVPLSSGIFSRIELIKNISLFSHVWRWRNWISELNKWIFWQEQNHTFAKHSFSSTSKIYLCIMHEKFQFDNLNIYANFLLGYVLSYVLKTVTHTLIIVNLNNKVLYSRLMIFNIYSILRSRYVFNFNVCVCLTLNQTDVAVKRSIPFRFRCRCSFPFRGYDNIIYIDNTKHHASILKMIDCAK